jgi:hypothetical protein
MLWALMRATSMKFRINITNQDDIHHVYTLPKRRYILVNSPKD